MWTIHPSLRNDNIYREILSNFGHGIAELPWARTNKALSGHTRRLDPSLRPGFHRYREWISKSLFDALYTSLDFDLFEEIKILDPAQIRKLAFTVKEGNDDFHAYNLFLWLVGLSRFKARLKEYKISIVTPEIIPDYKQTSKTNHTVYFSFRNTLNRHYFFSVPKRIFKMFRKKALLWYFFIKHRPAGIE